MKRAGLLLVLMLLPRPTAAGTVAPEEVTVNERLGAELPLELRFADEHGRELQLRELFDGKRPVILALAYYRCPMLCGLVLKGAAEGIGKLDWKVGEDFRVATISFDPSDRPYEAVQKRRAFLGEAGDALPKDAWPFLSGGSAEDLRRLAETLGFSAVRLDNGEFAHPAVLFVLTPQGKVSRYLYGIEYAPRDLKLALSEAADGKLGTTLERLLLRCYRFDPAKRKYGLYVDGLVRGGGVLTFGALAIALTRFWRKERRRSAP